MSIPSSASHQRRKSRSPSAGPRRLKRTAADRSRPLSLVARPVRASDLTFALVARTEETIGGAADAVDGARHDRRPSDRCDRARGRRPSRTDRDAPRGAGIGGSVARLPICTAPRHRPTGDRVLALWSRSLASRVRGPATWSDITIARRWTLLPRLLAALDVRRAAARRPQRRRLDRADPRRPPSGVRPGAAGAARVRRAADARVDPRRPGTATSGVSFASGWRDTTTTSTPPSGAGVTCGCTATSAPGTWRQTPLSSRFPTLLIQGADDPYGTLEQLDRIEARIRGPVSRLVVPGGHSPHLAAPDQVVAAVARFASDTPCGSEAPSTSVTL